MSSTTEPVVPLSNNDRFFIGGDWVKASSDAVIDVIDSATEQLYFQVPEAQPGDMDLAIGAARQAFDRGPWPRMTHAERAGYMRAMADELEARADDYATMWPHESGVVYAVARAGRAGYPETLRFYADLADDYPFEESFTPSAATSNTSCFSRAADDVLLPQGVRREPGALAHVGQELYPRHHRRGVGEAPYHEGHPVGRACP